VSLTLILTLFGAAQASCPALSIGAGTVDVGAVLPTSAELSEGDRACLAEVGARLAARPGVRTVTVAVRMPDADRIAGAGGGIGRAYTKAIAAGGISAARISAVVPAAADGEAASVSLTFTEKQSTSKVAVSEAVSGDVTAGPDLESLTSLAGGDLIGANTWVQTGPGATAGIALADGSRVTLQSDGLLRVGALRVNDQLKRVVELELQRGSLDTDVTSGGDGSRYEVTTRTGVAGVRGTRFRLTVEDDASRLETLDGEVALAGLEADSAEVAVLKGFGSRVDESGAPSAPSALPKAPEVRGPLDGEHVRSDDLRWKPVSDARGYVLQFARDAEFVLDVSSQDAAAETAGLGPDLDAGTWFWRVAATDTEGFVGDWSKVHAFELTEM